MQSNRFLPFIMGFFVVAALMGGTLEASPATWGPSGLINIPTADVEPVDYFDIGLHQVGDRGSVTVSYGLMDSVEVGMGILDHKWGDAEFTGHAKFAIMPETSSGPGVALGLSTAADNSYYMVASKRLNGLGVRGHIGIGKGYVDGFFAGISKVLNPVTVSTSSHQAVVPITTLMGEWDGSDLNVGAEFAFTQNVKLRVAAHDMEDLGLSVIFRTSF